MLFIETLLKSYKMTREKAQNPSHGSAVTHANATRAVSRSHGRPQILSPCTLNKQLKLIDTQLCKTEFSECDVTQQWRPKKCVKCKRFRSFFIAFLVSQTEAQVERENEE
jgi:hypothetical protein